MAINAYGEAARLAKGENLLLYYALYLMNIASSHRAMAQFENRRQNLLKSLEYRLEGLKYRTLQTNPSDFSSSITLIGIYYCDIAQLEEFDANIQRAIEAFQSAFVYRNAKTIPVGYADTQSSLGYCYLLRAERNHSQEDLKLAIQSFEESIQYRPASASPTRYGETLGELGYSYNLYASLVPDDAISHLAKAKGYFEESLKYHNDVEVTEQARILRGQAQTYQMLAKAENNVAYLDIALDMAKQALESRLVKCHFADAADSHEQVGWIYHDMGRSEQALESLREAVQLYRMMDLNYDADRLSGLIDAL